MPTDLSADIHQAIATVRERIQAACTQSQKDPARIRLLAVSKTKSAEMVRAAQAAGLKNFGENYVQEGVEKILDLADLRQEITWHFIGPLQSNKTKDVAQHFDWIHSVDRDKIAHRLSEQRPDHLEPLQVCLQVNVSGEASKSGISPELVTSLAQVVAALPRLSLRGLMAIPEPTDDIAIQRARFRQLVSCFQQARQSLPSEAQKNFNLLSMGMSADLESAIAESIPDADTMVRIGTALFGE
ncbi:MAG: hypothetical protein RJA58_629, partial [Pseudomonadota bacterium]